MINTSTLPSIDRICNQIGQLTDNSEDFEECKKDYQQSIIAIQDGKKDLERIDYLKKELRELMQKKDDAKAQLQQEEQLHISNVARVRNQHIDFVPLESCSTSQINRCNERLTDINNRLTSLSGINGSLSRKMR